MKRTRKLSFHLMGFQVDGWLLIIFFKMMDDVEGEDACELDRRPRPVVEVESCLTQPGVQDNSCFPCVFSTLTTKEKVSKPHRLIPAVLCVMDISSEMQQEHNEIKSTFAGHK